MRLKIFDIFLWTITFLYFLLYYCAPLSIFPFRSITLLILPLIGFLLSVFKKKHMKKSYFILLFLFFVLNGIITSFINEDSIKYILYDIFSILILIIFIINICDSGKHLKKLLQIIFWTGFIGGAIIGIFQKVSGIYLFVNSKDILIIDLFMSTATQSNSNYASLQLTTTMFIGLYLRGITKRVLNRSVFDIATLLIFVCILLSMSRTTIFAVVISFFFFIWLSRKKRIKLTNKNILLSIMLLLIISTSLIFSINNIEESINSFEWDKITNIKTTENLSIRSVQWDASIEVILKQDIDNFLFGLGRDYIYDVGTVSGYNMTTHNTPLEILIKYGFISFIIIVTIIIITFQNYFILYKKGNEFNALICGWIAVFICLQMISWFSLDSMIYIILSFVFLKISKNEQNVNES